MVRQTRREFLKNTGFAVGALMLPRRAIGDTEPAESKDKYPNLLIIYTDQQSCWTLGAYGGTLVSTPHIDSLAKNGAIFNNFFTNSAVCTPSRGCFLTGCYPHSHGAYVNKIEINRDEITIARILQQAGYETGYAGKWHLDGKARPGWIKQERSMGFEDCRFMYNRGHWKKIVEQPDGKPKVFPQKVIGDKKSFTTDWLADKTTEFIGKRRSQPFFYMISIPDPHSPYTVRSPYDTMFKPQDMPVPSTFGEEPPKWASVSKALLTKRGKTSAERKNWLRKVKAKYCGEVKCIDDNVGKILDCLRQTNQLDNTIIVFTTDHGDYMGEHGLMGKNQLYETAYRIPLLIRWPKRIGKGTVINNIVSTVDFQRTILALMGIAACGREQGRDGSGLLLGEKTDWKNEAFIHHSRHERAGIFTPEYELAYVKNGKNILFDRLNDPEQINNLFYNPAYKKIIDELTERIVRHNIEAGAPAAKWLMKLKAEKNESPGIEHIIL